jgi:hypothetical protein
VPRAAAEMSDLPCDIRVFKNLAMLRVAALPQPASSPALPADQRLRLCLDLFGTRLFIAAVGTLDSTAVRCGVTRIGASPNRALSIGSAGHDSTDMLLS